VPVWARPLRFLLPVSHHRRGSGIGTSYSSQSKLKKPERESNL